MDGAGVWLSIKGEVEIGTKLPPPLVSLVWEFISLQILKVQRILFTYKERIYRVILEAQFLHEIHFPVTSRLLLSSIQKPIHQLPPCTIRGSHFHPAVDKLRI